MRAIGAYWMLTLLAGLTLAGCVASPDAKQASATMTVAIDEYSRNIKAFQDLWISQIDKTQDDLGKAIVARTVRLKVTELAGVDGDFNRAWREKFQKQGLISLSVEIEDAQRQAREFVRRLRNAQLKENETAAAHLDNLLRGSANALRQSAEAIRETDPAAARELEEYAAFLASNGGKTIKDPWIRAHSISLLEWGAAKQEIPRNLENLQQVVSALQKTHATVDAWIQTDVTVSGEQIGQLVVDHQRVIGLTNEGGPR